MNNKQIICLFLVLLLVQPPCIAARGEDPSSEESNPIIALSGGSSTSCGIDYGDEPSDIISLRSLINRKQQTESLISQIILGKESLDTICGLDESKLTEIRAHNVDLALHAKRIYDINGDLILNDGDVIEERVGEVSAVLFAIDRRMKDLDDSRTKKQNNENKKNKSKSKNSLKVIQEKAQLRIYRAELLYMLNFWIIVRDWYYIEIIKKAAEDEAKKSGGTASADSTSGSKKIPLVFSIK